MSQGTLFGEPDAKLVREFLRFHEANPKIYQLFCRFTEQLLDAGYKRGSADEICHRIRWHVRVDVKTEDGFKINDHHVSGYARLWMADHPLHEGFFRTRASAFDGVWLQTAE